MGLTCAVDDDGLTVCGDQILIFQHLQNTTNGLTGTANDLADFLAGDFNLHAVRVGHRVRLFRQIQQSLRDTTGNVEEGKVANFFQT